MSPRITVGVHDGILTPAVYPAGITPALRAEAIELRGEVVMGRRLVGHLCQAHPAVIAEVRRILAEHAAR